VIMALIALMLLSLAAAAGEAFIPPAWTPDVCFLQTFDSPEAAPEIISDDARLTVPKDHVEGVVGKARRARRDSPWRLTAPHLSPHRPLTLSFWWAMTEKPKIDGHLHWVHLSNRGRAFVSHFSRGKGKWCALERPAGVFQIIAVEGVKDVGLLYDRHLLTSMDLTPGVWHHTAVVFRNGRQAQLFVDGKRQVDVTLLGRGFQAEHGFNSLILGPKHAAAPPLDIDEITVLSRALDPDQVRDYIAAVHWRRTPLPAAD